uniref:Uncharacterized protein n=1 Tax=Triticum urartu TaxID=4572 RepID=A0A8R7QLD4_TRIUA
SSWRRRARCVGRRRRGRRGSAQEAIGEVSATRAGRRAREASGEVPATNAPMVGGPASGAEEAAGIFLPRRPHTLLLLPCLIHPSSSRIP